MKGQKLKLSNYELFTTTSTSQAICPFATSSFFGEVEMKSLFRHFTLATFVISKTLKKQKKKLAKGKREVGDSLSLSTHSQKNLLHTHSHHS